jgi:16S rRNA (uracil1498-N3)-methyltransferase
VNLIILTDSDQTTENHYRVTDRRAAHIRTILKAGPGDTVRVGLLNGPIGKGEIVSVTDGSVDLVCQFDQEPPTIWPEVDLFCAISRPKTMRKILVTAAMMGVRRLMLVRANRTDKSYLASPLLTPEGWTPFLIEGLAQGGLTRLPGVTVHPLFRPFVEDNLVQFFGGKKDTLKLISDPTAVATLTQAWSTCEHNHILAAVGPEGGWVPFEVGLLEQQGFVGFSLGPWTLRVETAVVAVLAQIQLAARILPKGASSAGE